MLNLLCLILYNHYTAVSYIFSACHLCSDQTWMSFRVPSLQSCCQSFLVSPSGNLSQCLVQILNMGSLNKDNTSRTQYTYFRIVDI